MDGLIYKIINNTNGKVYIGQTHNLFKRKIKHISSAKRGSNLPIHNAIRKYGEENFKWVVLCENLSDDYLVIAEQVFIDYYGGIESNKNYNLREASLNGKPSIEVRKKISDSKIGEKNPMFGKKHSKDRIEKLRKRSIGNKYSLGKKHSNNAKLKISISTKGEKNPSYKHIELNTIIEKFNLTETHTLEELAIKIGVARKTIRLKLRNFGFNNFKQFQDYLKSPWNIPTAPPQGGGGPMG